VAGLRFHDSPRFSINLKDCRDAVIRDATIFVDSAVTRLGNSSSKVYPLNTDGIDIAAVNVTVFNVNITNYDDAIVVKPCRHTFTYCHCSGDVLAYNNTVTYSTGLAIGSVPPHEDHNCVRNVTFRDSRLRFPLKAIYVKTNPGNSGTGEITDITYQNITIDTALWWTVWIGPQQQNQPGQDRDSTGCNFMFPFVPVCPTQPRVTVRAVTLRDVTATNTVPLFQGPGVVLCNRTNPCTDFVFDNVVNTAMTGDPYATLDTLPPAIAWILPKELKHASAGRDFAYITNNVYAEVVAPVKPAVCVEPTCFWSAPA
jgi:polygalacturonase